jgi:hypothetical protein
LGCDGAARVCLATRLTLVPGECMGPERPTLVPGEER